MHPKDKAPGPWKSKDRDFLLRVLIWLVAADIFLQFAFGVLR